MKMDLTLRIEKSIALRWLGGVDETRRGGGVVLSLIWDASERGCKGLHSRPMPLYLLALKALRFLAG